VAVIVAVYDVNDQLIGVERRDTADSVISAPLLNPRNLSGPRFVPTVFGAAVELNAIDQIVRDIKSSTALTDAQRQAALDVFNSAKPGDAFTFVRQLPVQATVADVGRAAPPVIAIFTDP
jgi:hypothetical protein